LKLISSQQTKQQISAFEQEGAEMRQEEDRGEAGGGERAEAQAGAESPRSVENRNGLHVREDRTDMRKLGETEGGRS